MLLAGFQAEGSLGRILQDGARMVTIMGDEINVKAAIRRIEDYSGHADGPELVQWVKERLPIGRSIFLTHGEEEGQTALANDLQGLGVPEDCILIPSLDAVYDLARRGLRLRGRRNQAAHRPHHGGPARQPQ